jgi:hypothetical protein
VSDPINVVGKKQILVKGVAYEAVAIEDDNQPAQVSFMIMLKGKRVPLQVPGVGLGFVQFGVARQIEADANSLNAGSPLDALYEAAEQLLRATLDG